MKALLNSISLIVLCFILSCTKEVLNTTANIPPTIVTNPLGEGKVSFTAVGENIISYKWDFGDSTPNDITSNPIHQFKFNGEYKIILIVQVKVGKNIVQHIVNNTHTVSDLKDQTPNFTYTTLESGKLQFNLYAPFLKSIKWDFGDRTAESTEQNPSHVYRFNGDYNVRIIVVAEAKEGDKQYIITQKVSIAGLKDATPKFQLTLEADNRTVNVVNPSQYIKKIEWEFVDKYEGTTKSSVNNAKHRFLWNAEQQVKMTATVEAKNGDTTYNEIQNIKITGNPVPQKMPRIQQYPGEILGESPISFDFDEFYQFIEIESGDETFGKKKFGNGTMSKELIKYSYFYPHRGPFPLKITVTNPNGTNTFSIPVKGNYYSTFQQNFTFLIPKDRSNNSGNRMEIAMLPNRENRIQIVAVSGRAIVLYPFKSTDNLYQKLKVEFPNINGSQFQLEKIAFPSTITNGIFSNPFGDDYLIKLTPINHRFIYIRNLSEPGTYICTPNVTISTNSIKLFNNATIEALNNYYISEGDFAGFPTFQPIFNYFFTRYLPSTRAAQNGWFYISEGFPYYEQTKGENK